MLYPAEDAVGEALVDKAEVSETVEAVEGGLADDERGREQGYVGLVEKLVDAALVGFLTVHEEAAQDVKAAELTELAVGGYPLVGFRGGVGQILVEVHSGLLGYLDGLGLLHPDVDHLGQYLVGRHQHRGEYLALADVLLPQGDGEVVVLAYLVGLLAQPQDGGSPVEVVVDALVAHGLGDGAVHHLTERLLDGFDLGLDHGTAWDLVGRSGTGGLNERGVFRAVAEHLVSVTL